MALRPRAAQWFELLIPRDQLSGALEALARTHAVQLESHSSTSLQLIVPAIGESLEEFRRYANRYSPYWPTELPAPALGADPSGALATSLERLRAWAGDADGLVLRIEGIARELAELDELETLLSVAGEHLPDLHRLVEAGPLIGHVVVRLPSDPGTLSLPPSALIQRFDGPGASWLVGVGPEVQIRALREQYARAGARVLTVPAWLPGEPDAALRALERRRRQLAREHDATLARLGEVSRARELPTALANIRRLEWLHRYCPELPATERFAWVTGWSSDPDGALVRHALDEAGVRHLLRLTEPPAGRDSPILLRNPRWATPFELFARLIGTPGAAEVDPTPVVGILAPLMFGYMFGDVGHGLVVLIAGLALRRRFPALGLLVPGGVVSIFFGFMFGSIFTREDVIPALWMHPLGEPVTTLAAPLALGVFVILLGLALEGVQAYWARATGRWLASRAALVACYAGLIGAFADPRFLWLLAAGALWFMLGHGAIEAPGRRVSAGLGAIAEWLETMLQMGVNTVSFVRVGAFALAHAGLGVATVGVADAMQSLPAWLLVMLLGNALILVIEGLVVSIQTSRLILFEFFIRFLRGTGRAFEPLPAPDDVHPFPTQRRTP